MEEIKDVEFYTVTNVEEPSNTVITHSNDNETESLMRKILGESVSIAVGNFIFIPPLANPEVTSPYRTLSVIQQDNFKDNYLKTIIDVNGSPITLMTHISRIVHEGEPISVSVISSDKFSPDDLKIAFKNEFPKLFVDTMNLLLEHKKSLTYKG